MNWKGHFLLSVVFVGLAYLLTPDGDWFKAALLTVFGNVPDLDLKIKMILNPTEDRISFKWHRFFLLHSSVIPLTGLIFYSNYINADWFFLGCISLSWVSHLFLDLSGYKIVIIPGWSVSIFKKKIVLIPSWSFSGRAAYVWVLLWAFAGSGIGIYSLVIL